MERLVLARKGKVPDMSQSPLENKGREETERKHRFLSTSDTNSGRVKELLCDTHEMRSAELVDMRSSRTKNKYLPHYES
jgi:hypothetical protein